MFLLALSFDGLYGQDSYEYLRYSRALKNFFIHGTAPGEVVWPKGYPLLIVLFSLLIPMKLAAQIISLLALYGSAYFLLHILNIIIEEKQKNEYGIIALSFLLSPYILRLSLVVMADMLSIFCLLAAAYFLLSYSKKPGLKDISLFVFFGAYAVLSRYAALIPIAPLLIYGLWIWIKKGRINHLFALIPAALLLLIHFFPGGSGTDFTTHYFIENWHVSNFFKRSFVLDAAYQLPEEHYLLPNLLYYVINLFHPGFFMLILPALLLFYKKLDLKQPVKLIFLTSLIAYVLFLSGITFQSPRYLSLIYPFFLILLFPSLRALLEKFKANKNKIILGLAIVQLLLFVRAFYPFFQMNQLEQHLAAGMKPFQSNVLYSFEVDIALQNRGLQFDYKSMWEKEYYDFENGAYVLFNPDRIQKRFSDKNPMINWKNLNQSKNIKLIKAFDQNWKLYRIEP